MEELGIDYTGVHLIAIDILEGDPCTEEEFIAAWEDLDRRSSRVMERLGL